MHSLHFLLVRRSFTHLLISFFHSGYGGVTIWDVKSAMPVLTPHLPYDYQNPKHTYSASTWMYFDGLDKHVFIVGNMAGEIFAWSWDRTQNVRLCLILSDFLTDHL